MTAETTIIQEIDIETEEVADEDLADNFAYYCYFCEKKVKTDSTHNKICETLVRSKNFYCPFCVRNKFYTKKRWNVLQLTFRAVIGYLYWKSYRVKNKKVYLCEIKDMIAAHAKLGLYNPAFNYDPDTYIWFVDFNPIGGSKRQIDVEEINKTVINILACFNLNESTNGTQSHKLFEKYKEAIELFYSHRQRPDGKTLLVPTLSGCGGTMEASFDYDKCRNFLPKNLKVR
tara:strand:- start:5369 stop:6058 length:690 start_codon:yes stop_codon:yes gene_type:complete